MENNEEQKQEGQQAEHPRYQSQSGFVKVPLLRGFTEIKPLFEVLSEYNIEAGDRIAFICGGYVRFMCSPKKNPRPATDVDVYCKTEAIFDLLKKRFETDGLTIRHENDVAITYKVPEQGRYQYVPTIQLIKAINQGAIVAVGTMEEILSAFDFTVIRGGLISDSEALVDADFIHDEGMQLLRIKNIHCPISSTLRFMKYAKKSYWTTPMEVLKLFADWQNRDEDYKMKIITGVEKIEGGQQLSEEDIDELEKLMRID